MQHSIFSDNVSLPVIGSNIFKVEVNLDEALVVVSDHFLSVTLDAGGIHNHWSIINLTSPRILNLAKGLSPATLRVGGTSQDFVIFTRNGTKENGESFTQLGSSPIQQVMKSCIGCTTKVQYIGYNENGNNNYTMTGADWDLVNNFVLKVGWELIFGLNALLVKDWRLKTWDSSNAQELIQYTLNKGYKVAWELGNGMHIGVFFFIICSMFLIFTQLYKTLDMGLPLYVFSQAELSTAHAQICI